MKIGILQTGRSPETLQKNFGDYNDLFMDLSSRTLNLQPTLL